jgi:hypothetical protein
MGTTQYCTSYQFILESIKKWPPIKYFNKDINLHVQVKIVVAFWNNLHQVRLGLKSDHIKNESKLYFNIEMKK